MSLAKPPVEFIGSVAWVQYFRFNAKTLLAIPWERGVFFADETRDAIASSLQEFQLGESSEGKHLIACARRHAADVGDFGYVEALGLFIAEEHRHARDLGRVLDLAGIGRVTHSWPDAVFRFMRRRAGLELSIVVLVTAEIIAKVYYAAVREATGAPVLRRLCDQILGDEVRHVHFQTERIAVMRRSRSGVAVGLCQFLHRVLLAGTCLVVWHKHGRALRAGGYGFRRFWRETWIEMADALARCDPASYGAALGDADQAEPATSPATLRA
jgi:hypothetical protein